MNKETTLTALTPQQKIGTAIEEKLGKDVVFTSEVK